MRKDQDSKRRPEGPRRGVLVENHDLDGPERVSMACPKLGFGHAEVLARLGEVETIQIETTNHFTVPGIPESFERRGKARRVERAPNLEQLAKRLAKPWKPAAC